VKIVIVGTARRVINFSNFLANNKHEVHLICTNNINLEELSNNVIIHKEFLGKINSKSLKKAIRIPIDFYTFKKTLKNTNPDILHAFFVPWNGWFSALSNKHPFVLTTMGSDINPAAGAYKNLLRRILTPYAIKKADVVTVVTSEGARFVKSVLPDYSPVYYRAGFNSNLFYKSEKSKVLLKELGFNVNDFVILSPRGMGQLYNNTLIINAFSLVINSGLDDIKLVILGDHSNPNYKDYKNIVKELNIENYVVFPGKIAYEKMVDYYNLSDIIVSVPLADGFPATICESYACSKPLIVSNTPGISDIFQDGKNGFIIDSKDKIALAENIIKLYEDKFIRYSISDNNIKASKTLDINEMNQEILKIYETLLQSKSVLG